MAGGWEGGKNMSLLPEILKNITNNYYFNKGKNNILNKNIIIINNKLIKIKFEINIKVILLMVVFFKKNEKYNITDFICF